MKKLKLVVVIASDDDADRLIASMVGQGLPATKISSTGGFLRRGNATILSGVEADEVPIVLSIVRRECRARKEAAMLPAMPLPEVGVVPASVEVRVGGAVVFVLGIDRFEKT